MSEITMKARPLTDLTTLSNAVSVLICHDVTISATFTTNDGKPEILMLRTPAKHGIEVTDIRETVEEFLPPLPGIVEKSGDFMGCRLYWQEPEAS